MTAEVCGSWSSPRKVAPPLKSTSTKFSVSEEWVSGHGQDQGAQQLALAGAGGADEHAVRAHAALGGLLDVEFDGRAVLVDADRHPQPVGRDRDPQSGRGSKRGQVVDIQQLGHVEVGGERLGDLGGDAEPNGETILRAARAWSTLSSSAAADAGPDLLA